MKLFMFRPEKDTEDECEKIAYDFAEHVLKNVTCEVIDFSRFNKNVSKFKDLLMKPQDNGTFFAAYCHGSHSSIHIKCSGDISIKSYEAELFKNMYCYFVSCNTMNELGKAAKENGALGVIGYKDEVWFPLTGADDLESVKRCINPALVSWIGGMDAKDVYQMVRNAYEKEMDELDASGVHGYHRVILLGILRANQGSLVFL